MPRIPLRPEGRLSALAAAAVSVSPGHPASLHLSSQFASGHATLTWQPTGKPIVTWDFVVEID